jgi:hypothetical protein
MVMLLFPHSALLFFRFNKVQLACVLHISVDCYKYNSPISFKVRQSSQ